MKILTKDLIGPALNWAVGVANGTPGLHLTHKPGKVCVYGTIKMPSGEMLDWPVQPSTDREQGGYITEREKISCIHATDGRDALDKMWFAYSNQSHEGALMKCFYGPTPLIAAMRCYVYNNIGEYVDVPDELAVCETC